MAEKQPPQEVEVRIDGISPEVYGRDGKKRCVVDLTYWSTDGQEVPAQATVAPWDMEWLAPHVVKLPLNQVAKVLLSWRGNYIDLAGIPGVQRPAQTSTQNGAAGGGDLMDRMKIRMHVQGVVAKLAHVIKSPADWDRWYEHLSAQMYGKRPEGAAAAPARTSAARPAEPAGDGL